MNRSQSQRLRGVLYKLWEKGSQQEPFDLFYFKTMNVIIKQFKDKIDELQ